MDLRVRRFGLEAEHVGERISAERAVGENINYVIVQRCQSYASFDRRRLPLIHERSSQLSHFSSYGLLRLRAEPVAVDHHDEGLSREGHFLHELLGERLVLLA
ncbi:MAG: hypothetical protein ACREUQ_08960 [Burkholderiales bacterium]